MTPSQSNITRSTLCNASATLLFPSRQRNLSWRGFAGNARRLDTADTWPLETLAQIGDLDPYPLTIAT